MLWSSRSCFLILPPGALTPHGIEGAMKRDVSKHWCTLQWCASRGWFIAHENWTSYVPFCTWTICCDRISFLHAEYRTIFIELWNFLKHLTPLNTLRSGNNGRHLVDGIFNGTYLTDIICILIEMSLKFVSAVQVTVNQHRFCDDLATSYYLNQWSHCSLTHIHMCMYGPSVLNLLMAVTLYICLALQFLEYRPQSVLSEWMNISLAANAFGCWMK